ncbi:MAG: GNAT family N-acetyltransferase, partial [Hyphomonadaceae bacterium]
MAHAPFLTTSRLHLRPLTLDDVQVLHEAFSDPDTCRYTSSPPHVTEDETRARVEKIMADTDCHEWAITEGAGEPALGTVGLYPSRDGIAGLGYMLHPEACGRGIASEAVKAVLAHGFEVMYLRRIYADIDPDNTASIRL